MPRPPVPPLPDGTEEPGPVPAKALPEAGLIVEDAMAPDGTGLPTAPVVREEAVCLVIADTPVDEFGTGAVDGRGETGSVLATVDGVVRVACPGRLVNFRGSERVVDVEADGDVGADVLGSTALGSVSWR